MYFRNKLSLSYLIYYVLYTELVTGEGRVDLFPWIQFTNYTWVPCTVFYLLCTMHYVLYTRACYWREKSWPAPLNTVHKLYKTWREDKENKKLSSGSCSTLKGPMGHDKINSMFTKRYRNLTTQSRPNHNIILFTFSEQWCLSEERIGFKISPNF